MVAQRRKMIRKNLLWIDLEMTGLNPQEDVILEIASIITDDQLEVIAHGPELVIHYNQAVLDKMDEWCTKTHKKSGLCEKVLASRVTLKEAQEQTLAFIKEYFKEDEAVLAGNSVWNDKYFLREHMPTLDRYLNYRIVDVSSIKELIKRWYPQSPYTDFKKRESHRALIDIEESIEELKHYRTHFFIPEGLEHAHEHET